MALTVNMPQLGESVTEGTIARWLKQPGEFVAKYESIAEVVTDKVNAEIPSPADGSMGDHIAKEGDVVSVGQPICNIETVEQAQHRSAWAQPTLEEDASAGVDAPASRNGDRPAAETSDAAPAAAGAPVAAGGSAPGTVSTPETPVSHAAGPRTATPVAGIDRGGQSPSVSTAGYHLTPAVRALVRQHGVDLARVAGTGLGGRITRRDVLDFVARGDTTTSAPVAGNGPATASQYVSASLGDGDVLVPLTPMRRAIAEHMVRSKQTSPHAWLMVEVDMSRVVRLRGVQKDDFRRRYGVSLTFLPFIARATCEALHEFPVVNSVWSDDGIVEKRDVHLGIAVGLEESLIVPVIRDADRLSVAGLATTMSDLADRARTNKLKLEEIQGGTFTLNNTGALGTVLTQPIINQPQAGILATDAIVKRPVVVEGDAIAVRSMMNLCLSFDHRIIDGLQAARFVGTIKRKLESTDPNAAF